VEVRHAHYDQATGNIVGTEHLCRVKPRARRVDGYVSLSDLSDKIRTRLPPMDKDVRGLVFEYQGSTFHGHPFMWQDLEELERKEDHPLYDQWQKDLAKWRVCEEQDAVKVFYMLDKDFKAWKKHSVGTSIFSVCREASAHFE
jgi:hypothetical protein